MKLLVSPVKKFLWDCGNPHKLSIIKVPMKHFRPTHVQIDLKQLIANFQFLKNLGSNPFLCPMIKANAYGHGDKKVAGALAEGGCQFLGVSSVEEALGLGDLPSSTRILSFGFSGIDAAKELLAHNITPVVSDFNQLQNLVEKVKTTKSIHIKFNTGMNRLGFDEKDYSEISDLLSRNPFIRIEGLCTHLHSGEDFLDEQGFSRQQMDKFRKIQSYFDPNITSHVFNSASMVAFHKKDLPLSFGSRPGLLVYGIDPLENLSLKPLIGPVMEFKSKIVSIRKVKSGEVISYGGTWQANQNSLIGIVPAGYADGVPVGLSNKGDVLVKEKRIPIRGQVTMDYTMIDLTGFQGSSGDLTGEEVIFIGHQGNEQITVEEIAGLSGRLSYEIITGIGERVPRYYGVSK